MNIIASLLSKFSLQFQNIVPNRDIMHLLVTLFPRCLGETDTPIQTPKNVTHYGQQKHILIDMKLIKDRQKAKSTTTLNLEHNYIYIYPFKANQVN